MATLVLGAVGTAIAGPFGGFIGAAAGSYLDQAYLMPWLFPKPPIDGPKLDDLSLQTASEGSPIRVLIGPLNRAAGVVIYQSELKQVKETKKVGSSGNTQKYNTYSYYVDLAIHFHDATKVPFNRFRKVWADQKLIWDGEKTAYCSAIRFYDGTQTTPDPLLEAVRGVGKTPAYMDSAYIVIENLQYDVFGHVPNIQVQGEQDNDVSVGDAISYAMSIANFSAGEYETNRIAYCFKGMQVSGPQKPSSFIGQILEAYAITAYEEDNKIKFVPRGAEDQFTVTVDELSAHPEGSPDSAAWPVEWSDKSNRSIASNAQVRFISSDNDLLAGSERQFRAGTAGENTISKQYPITLSSEEGRALARRLLWQDEVTRFAVSFTLPPKYLTKHEGSVALFERDGIQYEFFITHLQIGDDFLVACDGIVQIAQVFSQRGVSSGARTNSSTVPTPDITGVVLDIPAMTAEQVESVGFYTAACNEDSQERWVGAAIYVAPDTTNYVWAQSCPVEAVIGELVDLFSAGPVYMWDDGNTITVELQAGTLETCTEDECLQGQNRAAIRNSDGDWEIIGFTTVELVSGNTYRLTHLLRGLRGTERFVGTHNPGDLFVLLVNDGSIGWAEQQADAIGSTRYYKSPSKNQLLSEATSGSLAFKGVTTRCFDPVDLSTTVDGGSGDVTVEWTRRSRKVFFPFATDVAPFSADELPERWEIEIWSGLYGGLLLRTSTASSATYTYTAAEQTADGLTPGASSLRFVIYQIGAFSGRGSPATVEFHP